MDKNLIKVEIGCGKTKTDGYIGVDRFPLQGVDIVADINKGLPFDSDSVDIIYACHSLEHMENLQNIMEEIYRICKNKAIVQILSPYSNTSLNEANYYHKIAFNEDTFRLCTSYPTQLVDFDEYYCPHSPIWGLADSDNSEVKMQFEPLQIEFFHYKEYRHLTKEQKRHARRALHNVCDQLFYVLVVNKSNAPFSNAELKKLSEQAKIMEPSVISALRNRDLQYNDERSILTDITQPLMEKQECIDSKIDNLTSEFIDITQPLMEKQECIDSKIYNLTSEFTDIRNLLSEINRGLKNEQAEIYNYIIAEVTNLKEENSKLKQTIEMQYCRYMELEQKNNQRLDDVTSLELEILQNIENSNSMYNNISVFHAKSDLFSLIQKKSQDFIDQIILNCINFNKNSILKLSKVVPYEDYFEYFIKGYGEKINYYLVSNYGACLFVEVVQDGKIVKQESFIISHEGLHQIEVGKIKGNAAIRFRTLNNTSIVRVLEVSNRRIWIFEKKHLAAFID